MTKGAQRVKLSPRDKGRSMIWLHGASLGDINALSPLGVRLQAQGEDLLMSAVTESGRARIQQLFPRSPFIRPPLLSPWRAKRICEDWSPKLLILERLELWPPWLRVARAQGLPVVVVNGHISVRSLRISPILRASFAGLSLFCGRTQRDLDRAIHLGLPPERGCVTGDSKYDRILSAPIQAPDVTLRDAIGSLSLVIGCLHQDEEEAALTALASYLSTSPSRRALIAPRYLSRISAIEAAARRLKISTKRRSEGAGGCPAQLCLLDSYGELASIYALAPIAIIGGTFGRRGGQNILEPARWEKPVIFGPRAPLLEERALEGAGGYRVTSWAEAITLSERPLVAPSLSQLRERLGGALSRQWSQLGAAGLI
ncbi:MAG: glycosyltransferase N-terminal domain-containing protein [Myxococcota bacterium]|nr:glycosyltransferase N-terminal domain-containing protein [Myxococcota bacterium]